MSDVSYSGGDPFAGVNSTPLPQATSPVSVQRAIIQEVPGWLFIIPGSEPVFVDEHFSDRIARKILFSD